MSSITSRNPKVPSALVLALILSLSIPPLWVAARAMVDSADEASAGRSSGPASALPAPGDVSAVASGDRVRLAWTPVPGASGYVVYEGTRAGAENSIVANSVDGMARGLTLPAKPRGSLRFFRVKALQGRLPGAASAEVHAPALGSPWQELPSHG